MLKLKIITPERMVVDADVDQVTLATEQGEITILPGHIPLVSTLKSGEARYKIAGEEHSIAVAGGFVEVRSAHEVVVLADAAEYSHEIDVSKAEEAHRKAAQLMTQEIQTLDVDYARLQAKLEKELNRIRVGNKYRHLPGQPS